MPLKDINTVAEGIGIKNDELIPWGRHKAKVSLDIFRRLNKNPDGKLVLVTTTNPTFEGEGKTTITIGLAQALAHLGKKVCLAIREPIPAWWVWLAAAAITCGAGLGTAVGHWLDELDGLRKEKAMRDGQQRAASDGDL